MILTSNQIVKAYNSYIQRDTSLLSLSPSAEEIISVYSLVAITIV